MVGHLIGTLWDVENCLGVLDDTDQTRIILVPTSRQVFLYNACACVLTHSVVSDSVWPPWTVPCQAPLSMEFSRQEYWSGLLCPPLGDLTNPGIHPSLLHLLHWEAGSLPLAPPGKPHTMPNTVHVYQQRLPVMVLISVMKIIHRATEHYSDAPYRDTATYLLFTDPSSCSDIPPSMDISPFWCSASTPLPGAGELSTLWLLVEGRAHQPRGKLRALEHVFLVPSDGASTWDSDTGGTDWKKRVPGDSSRWQRQPSHLRSPG